MGLLDKIKAIFSADLSKSQSFKSQYSESANLDTAPMKNTISNEESIIDKTKEFISGTVDEVKEQGSQLWNEVKEKATELNESTKEFREQLVEKAKDTIEKIDDFVDQTVEKAKKLEADEKIKDADQDSFADRPIEFGKTLTESRKNFFDKAEQWLKENESHGTNANKQSEVTKHSNHNKVINPLELPKDPE